MRFFMIMMLSFIVQNAWGDVLVRIVDQDNKPVTNAVVSLLGHVTSTPNKLAVMDQMHIQFSPHVLVIQKGQKVSFPNSDDIRHQVYSFSNPKVFELKLYKGTESKPVVFDKPGLVVLGCNIHDGMIGYIFIADNVYAIKTNAQGEVRLPARKGDKVTIWSERFINSTESSDVHELNEQAVQTIQLDLLPPVKLKMEMNMSDDNETDKFGKKF